MNDRFACAGQDAVSRTTVGWGTVTVTVAVAAAG